MSRSVRPLLLLVEDEFFIREFLQMVLQDEGFDVELAATGRAAIGLLQGHSRRLCGLITDIDLGHGSTGWAVACAARDLQPDLPIVYMSGGSAGDWAARGVDKSVMVAKPFAPEHLVAVLSSVLASSGGGMSDMRPTPPNRG